VRSTRRGTRGLPGVRRARPVREEAGFTLIELLVVMVIIGILIMIGLPTYLGARERAADRTTEANVRTGLAAAMTFFAETGTYTGYDVTAAEQAEPSLDWVAPGPPVGAQVAILTANGYDLLMVSKSPSGNYVCLAQQFSSPVTTTGKGATFADVDTQVECTNGW
jgi:prepilin-type N-terminal cleavage/methylation domain-containing protein